MAATKSKPRYSRKTVLQFPWSDYQKNLFHSIATLDRNILVAARAGSGKTKSIEGVCASLPVGAKVAVLAFNVHIANELTDRIPSSIATCTTAHKMGMTVIRRFFGGEEFRPNDRKYKSITKDAIASLHIEDGALRKSLRSLLEKMVHYTQVTLTDWRSPEAIGQMVDRYGLIEVEDVREFAEQHLFGMVEECCDRGINEALEDYNIGLDDLIWLPEVLEMPAPQKDYVIVDELQDANNALIALYKRMGGKFIGVGDPAQAIYGFSGSTSDAWQKCMSEFDAIELSLPVTYRCPKSHVALAQRIVPDILPKDDAAEGSIAVVHPKAVKEMLRSGDLVLSRTTAPLIGLCLRLIQSQVAAQVRGRDIGSQLTDLIDRVYESFGNFPEGFKDAVKDYCEPRIKEAIEDEDESAAQAIEDRMMAVCACFDAYGYECDRVTQFKARIEALFCDDADRPPICLSTVHKAKGDESDRVFLLGTNLLPFTFKCLQDWQVQQEHNLLYVALTRSKSELYLVPLPDKQGKIDGLNDDWGGIDFDSIAPIEEAIEIYDIDDSIDIDRLFDEAIEIYDIDDSIDIDRLFDEDDEDEAEVGQAIEYQIEVRDISDEEKERLKAERLASYERWGVLRSEPIVFDGWQICDRNIANEILHLDRSQASTAIAF